MEYVGVEEGRVQFTWVSASESTRFAGVITKATEKIKALGPAKKLAKNPSRGVTDVRAN